MAQSSPEQATGVIPVDELSSYSVGDVFLGTSKRLLEPLILFDIERCGFMGLNTEFDYPFMKGYSLYFHDLRAESHGDFHGKDYGGHAAPTAHIGAVPEGIELTNRSAKLMRWIIEEAASVVSAADGDAEYLEWLRDEFAAGNLIIDDSFACPIVTTNLKIDNEARFKEYLQENPDSNVALSHPPTAKKYLS